MKKHKVKLFAAVLVVFTIIAAAIHLNTREVVAEGTLRLVAGGKETTLDISKFAYEQVTGVRVNGKGEEIPVEALGVSLRRVVEDADILEYTTVTVIADDFYSAEISAEEVEDGTKAFLILDDEKKLRLVVFGDTNSKRSVSNVAQVVVE